MPVPTETLIAVDPGPRQSAWVVLDIRSCALRAFGLEPNADVRTRLRTPPEPWRPVAHLAVEMVASYGMAVGKDVFETALAVGRFVEAWGGEHTLVYRREVKMSLCGRMTAKDTNIRQALIDLYPPTGGGKTPQIGTKNAPGPLYGVRQDIWAALAVGVTWMEERALWTPPAARAAMAE